MQHVLDGSKEIQNNYEDGKAILSDLLPHTYYVVNLDVNFQYILDPGEWDVTHAGIFLDMVSLTQVLDAWGLAGVRTDRIGFKHVWEIWYMQYLFQTDAY